MLKGFTEVINLFTQQKVMCTVLLPNVLTFSLCDIIAFAYLLGRDAIGNHTPLNIYTRNQDKK